MTLGEIFRWPKGPSASREAAGNVGMTRRSREAAGDTGVNGATWEPSGRMTPATTADSVATSAASAHNGGPVSSENCLTRETEAARGAEPGDLAAQGRHQPREM